MPVTLTGTSVSAKPFVSMSPLEVDFQGIVIGAEGATLGTDSTFVLNNIGQSPMTILGLAYTSGGVTDPTSTFHNLTSTMINGTTLSVFDANGHFTSDSMPKVGTVIPGGGSVTVDANFKSSVR